MKFDVDAQDGMFREGDCYLIVARSGTALQRYRYGQIRAYIFASCILILFTLYKFKIKVFGSVPIYNYHIISKSYASKA